MLRRLIQTGVVALTLAAIAGSAFGAIGRSDGAEAFAATFATRAPVAAAVKSCRELPAVQKIEGRYTGTMSFGAEERALNFSLEVLFDRSRGVGVAKGNWQLATPPEPDFVGRGELVAVVKAVEATPPEPDATRPEPDAAPLDSEATPPDPDLELHGLLIGSIQPSDAGMPGLRLIGNVAGSITDGTLNFTGALGDSAGVSSNPAALLPAVKC